MESRDDLAVARALVRGMAFEDLRPEAMEFVRKVLAGEGLVRLRNGGMAPAPARTRLKASAMVLDRTDPVPRVGEAPHGPISIAVVLESGPDRAPVPSLGVAVRLDGLDRPESNGRPHP